MAVASERLEKLAYSFVTVFRASHFCLPLTVDFPLAQTIASSYEVRSLSRSRSLTGSALLASQLPSRSEQIYCGRANIRIFSDGCRGIQHRDGNRTASTVFRLFASPQQCSARRRAD